MGVCACLHRPSVPQEHEANTCAVDVRSKSILLSFGMSFHNNGSTTPSTPSSGLTHTCSGEDLRRSCVNIASVHHRMDIRIVLVHRHDGTPENALTAAARVAVGMEEGHIAHTARLRGAR